MSRSRSRGFRNTLVSIPAGEAKKVVINPLSDDEFSNRDSIERDDPGNR